MVIYCKIFLDDQSLLSIIYIMQKTYLKTILKDKNNTGDAYLWIKVKQS